MIAYIQQLAKLVAERFQLAFGQGELEDVEDYIVAVREELDRLDPRDFVADARVKFIELRLRVRRVADASQRDWYFLATGLRSCQKDINDLRQRSASHQELQLSYERQESFYKTLTENKDLFAAVAMVLNSYGGMGSQAITRSFAFVQDADLRKIIERDYRELKQILFPDGAWKSVVIMAGSILEAILYDLLTRDGARVAAAMASTKAPRKRGGVVKDLTTDTAEDEWKLYDLINVAVDLGFLRADDAATIHQALREYRNYVHPRKEIKEAQPCSEAEAMQSLGALEGICNHLS